MSISAQTYRGIDLIGVSAVIGSIIGYLPIIAAVVAMAWYIIQISESPTVRHWLEKRRVVRRAKKITRLKAIEKIVTAQLDALETLRQATVDARDKVEIAKVEAEKLRIHEEHKAES